MTTIRPERTDDFQSTRNVNTLAFGRTVEADLVEELRKNGKLIISLVAETEAGITGHIAFSPRCKLIQATWGVAQAGMRRAFGAPTTLL